MRELGPKGVQGEAIGAGRRARIDSKELIAQVSGMHVKVEMRDFLVRAGTSRMPNAEAIGGEALIDGARDAGDHSHGCHGDGVVGGAYVGHVLSGNDQNVPWVELSEIEQRDGERILRDDGGGPAV